MPEVGSNTLSLGPSSPKGPLSSIWRCSVKDVEAVKSLDVLIPTYRRKAALATTLAGLFGQTFRDFDIIIADQTETAEIVTAPEIETLRRAFALHDQRVTYLHRLARRGMAEQRHFLLSQARAPYVLYLDDDLLLEPEAVERMLKVIKQQGCGFVGMAPIGLSHVDDLRPH